jgi:hypothetical protein
MDLIIIQTQTSMKNLVRLYLQVSNLTGSGNFFSNAITYGFGIVYEWSDKRQINSGCQITT